MDVGDLLVLLHSRPHRRLLGARGRARLAGNRTVARRATLTALAMTPVNPALLIAELGCAERFLNMLRTFKVTSPMSVGSWILSAYGDAATLAGLSELTGRAPRIAAAADGAPAQS